jgi:hypothetical protein
MFSPQNYSPLSGIAKIPPLNPLNIARIFALSKNYLPNEWNDWNDKPKDN